MLSATDTHWIGSIRWDGLWLSLGIGSPDGSAQSADQSSYHSCDIGGKTAREPSSSASCVPSGMFPPLGGAFTFRARAGGGIA